MGIIACAILIEVIFIMVGMLLFMAPIKNPKTNYVKNIGFGVDCMLIVMYPIAAIIYVLGIMFTQKWLLFGACIFATISVFMMLYYIGKSFMVMKDKDFSKAADNTVLPNRKAKRAAMKHQKTASNASHNENIEKKSQNNKNYTLNIPDGIDDVVKEIHDRYKAEAR